MAALRRLRPALLLAAAAAAQAGARQGRAPLDFELELDPQVSLPGGPAGAVLLQAQIQSSLGGRSLAARAGLPGKNLPWGPEEITNPEPFDCSAHPGVCELFNCKDKRLSWRLTPDKHTNYHTIACFNKKLLNAWQYCAAGNVSAYARMVPGAQRGVMPAFGRMDIREIDGQYCYEAGHCTRGLQENVYDGMSISEAEAICDQRYGREAWTTLNQGDNVGSILFHTNAWTELFNSKVRIAAGFSDTMGKVACAMGNYHCDIAYCRQWYCDKSPYKDQAYARLAREAFAGERTGSSA